VDEETFTNAIRAAFRWAEERKYTSVRLLDVEIISHEVAKIYLCAAPEGKDYEDDLYLLVLMISELAMTVHRLLEWHDGSPGS
jgi:hypothetical protein